MDTETRIENLVGELNQTKPGTTYSNGCLYNANYYINFARDEDEDDVILDGNFTTEELRIIITIMELSR